MISVTLQSNVLCVTVGSSCSGLLPAAAALPAPTTGDGACACSTNDRHVIIIFNLLMCRCLLVQLLGSNHVYIIHLQLLFACFESISFASVPYAAATGPYISGTMPTPGYPQRAVMTPVQPGIFIPTSPPAYDSVDTVAAYQPGWFYGTSES